VPSPDGRVVAFVRNHPNVDPPDQSLWLKDSNGRATELTRLAPDADWCNLIVWSSDSTRVTFRECEHTWQPNPPERQNARGSRVHGVDGGCSDAKTVTLADVPAASLLAPGRPR